MANIPLASQECTLHELFWYVPAIAMYVIRSLHPLHLTEGL